jgi:NADPH:quinone reductase-like Zn-dependent oxidoreductase
MTAPNQMQAWQYTHAKKPFQNSLRLNSTSTPVVPKSSSETKPSILIKVHAVSLNPADYALPTMPIMGRLINKKPATPGLDFAGTIVATPAGSTTDLKPGDAVFGRLDWPYQHGTLAEYTLGVLNGIVKLPSNIDFAQGAALGSTAITAYQSLAKYIKAGDRVFINGGAGGVGGFAIQIAKLLGAVHVTVTCSAANEARCRDLGADEIINYRETDVLRELKSNSKDTGKLYDHVIENVADISRLFEDAHYYLKPGGTFVQVAATTDSIAGVWSMAKRALWPAWLGGSNRKWVLLLAENKIEDLRKIAEWVESGELKISIDSKYGFEQAKEAFEKLSSKHAKGKVVVEIVR